jgi:purine-binding chemotaxis protein CheW
MQAFLLPVGRDCYALPIEAVREVVPNPALTPVPTAHASVLGLFNVRGEIIPLLDTSALLDLGPLAEITFAVVVTTARGPAGLAVSGLPRAVELENPMGGADGSAAISTYAVGSDLAVLLDLDQLLKIDRGVTA